MKIGNFSCNPDACFAMGKEAFLESHTHVHNAEAVWKQIEKAVKKKPKPSEENGPEKA
jgi:hypothetical protein